MDRLVDNIVKIVPYGLVSMAVVLLLVIIGHFQNISLREQNNFKRFVENAPCVDALGFAAQNEYDMDRMIKHDIALSGTLAKYKVEPLRDAKGDINISSLTEAVEKSRIVCTGNECGTFLLQQAIKRAKRNSCIYFSPSFRAAEK